MRWSPGRVIWWATARLTVSDGGRMGRHNRVCVLSDLEAAELRAGQPISCADHKHVDRSEAFDLTTPAFVRTSGEAAEPVAEWVGPKHICYFANFTLKTVSRTRLPVGGTLRITTKQRRAA